MSEQRIAHSNLSKAKSAKNDEFYTQYHDIEKEINAYLDYDENVFRDKTILLPCDDPEWSNFTKYFAQNFERFGIKKLISTSFAPNSKVLKFNYQPSLFESENPKFDKDKTLSKGKIFTLCKDNSEDDRIDLNDLEWSYLNGDGDFRSDEIKKLRDEADIVITNPPFSLFREFLAWIIEADKKFLMIGNINAITYKEVFAQIKNNKAWLGTGIGRWISGFIVPKQYELYGTEARIDDEGNRIVSTNNCLWLTNLDHGRRHEPLQLMTMNDNLRYNKRLKGKEKYDYYDNYDAIEIPFTNAIPSDYDGAMAVPITFLDKYNPEQFEILSCNDFRKNPNTPFKEHGLIKDKDGTIDGKATYVRVLIKHKKMDLKD
ncbi:adenine-specific methyltransferase EcoRI family protein [Acinetobacter venetianus]|uniref:adenine-specific methyltransferase EcoRI family protein n=1 Tax=Acinetobacter venetianus TaxID=52133 RepID=UPI00241CA05F|nr:adenine-specific methyltransferase EcoRI family protein [Acinetobacter venetianus]